MPNEPMSAEEFAKTLSRILGPKDEWGEHNEHGAMLFVAQRDRDILTKAADRMCKACGEGMREHCEKLPGGIEKSACEDRKAILNE